MNNIIVSSNSSFTCTIYYKHLFITITCLWFWYYKRLLHCFRLREKSFVLRRSPVSRSWRKVTLTAPWTVWRTTTQISRNRSSNSRHSLLRRNNSMPRGRPQNIVLTQHLIHSHVPNVCRKTIVICVCDSKRFLYDILYNWNFSKKQKNEPAEKNSYIVYGTIIGRNSLGDLF